jgi:hypothetical protein
LIYLSNFLLAACPIVPYSLARLGV